MSKNKKYIIIAVVAILVIGIILFARRNRNKQIFAPEERTNIPDAVQQELAYHNEGETLTYAGVKYVVENGVWKQITI